MSASDSSPASPLTRRHFALWMTASGLTACGGGSGEATAPAPAPAPPAPGPASLSLTAGALGGTGFLAGTGTDARLPPTMTGHAFNSRGELWFLGYGSYEPEDRMVGKVSPQGTVSYAPPAIRASSGLFDAQDRYLVGQNQNDPGVVVAYLDGENVVPLAGQYNATTMQDGRGSAARIVLFMSPVRGNDGLVYFLDEPAFDSNAQTMLRTLAPDGTVTTLIPTPTNSVLILSPGGAVRRFRREHPGNLVEWAELVRSSSGEVSWSVLPHSWPGNVVPLAPVKDGGGRYWGTDPATANVAQYGLDGTHEQGWELSGRVRAAAANAVDGRLAVSVAGGLSTGAFSGDALFLLDPVKLPASVPTHWVGLQEQPGQTDGTSGSARFNFIEGVDACTDAAGVLHTVSAQQHVPSAPVRTVSSTGQVLSLPLARPATYRHLAEAYGYLLTYDPVADTVLRSPKSGSSNAWEPWVRSSVFDHYPPVQRSPLAGLQVLRTDTTGQLWFATRVVPLSVVSEIPPASGVSVIGTISATGQLQVVVGDPEQVHSAANYPPLDQRPWHMDVTDIAFEGGSSPVSWVLCNRTVATPEGKLVRYVPELVRLEGATRQSFALPTVKVTRPNSPPYQQLCVLPSRPGQVFLSSPCGVYRWTLAKGLELVAGQADPTPGGVRLGALPASLNLVKFISPGPDANSLYVGSENSVLRLTLPA